MLPRSPGQHPLSAMTLLICTLFARLYIYDKTKKYEVSVHLSVQHCFWDVLLCEDVNLINKSAVQQQGLLTLLCFQYSCRDPDNPELLSVYY